MALPLQGWGGMIEIPEVPPGKNLGLEIRYSADNPGAAATAAFTATYRMITEGEDMGAGGQVEYGLYEVPIPASAAKEDLLIFRQTTVRNSKLAAGDQIHLEGFYRDRENPKDTFFDNVYVCGFMFYWTSEPFPEV